MKLSLKQLLSPSYEREISTRMSKKTVLKTVESAGEDFFGKTTEDGFAIRPRTRAWNTFARPIINGVIQETSEGSTVHVRARVKKYFLLTWYIGRVLMLVATVAALILAVSSASLPNVFNVLYALVLALALELIFQFSFRLPTKKALQKLEQLLLL